MAKKSQNAGGIKKASYKSSLASLNTYAKEYDKALRNLTADLQALWKANEDQNPAWNGKNATAWYKKAVKNQNNHVKCLKSINANLSTMQLIYDYHKGA